MEKQVRLGEQVQDRVSGFKGIAVATTTYLQGCNRILVQPRIGKDGELPEPCAFDESDLKVIGNGILPKPETKKNGGPRRMAERARMPEARR